MIHIEKSVILPVHLFELTLFELPLFSISGGGNSSDYDNAPTSSKVMSSSFGGGVGVGGSGGLGPSSKGGGAPRTIWDAHFTSRSEGANIHNAASSSSGTERSGHYYSTVPLKDAGREASSPAHTSSSESLGNKLQPNNDANE